MKICEKIQSLLGKRFLYIIYYSYRYVDNEKTIVYGTGSISVKRNNKIASFAAIRETRQAIIKDCFSEQAETDITVIIINITRLD